MDRDHDETAECPSLRLFLGFPPSESLAETLARSLDRARRSRLPGARWVPAENIHATLAFLGTRRARDRQRLARILAPVTGEVTSFEARITGTGVFPSRRRPRVLWLGIDGPQQLYDLQSRIVRTLEQHLAIEPEQRRYRPHFTLARARSHFPARYVERCEACFEGLVGERFRVQEVTLWHSQLSASGARYRALERLALG